MKPRLDLTEFPLVVITYAASMTAQEADTYGVELATLLARGKVGSVVDLRAVDTARVSASDRAYIAKVVDSVTKRYANTLLAEAIVLDSTVLRCMYTAYSWLRVDRSYHSHAFGNVAEAKAWVREQLRQRGVTA